MRFEGRALGDIFEGQAAIRAFVEGWFGMYEELEYKLEEVHDLGDGVVFAVVFQEARPACIAGHVQQREGMGLRLGGRFDRAPYHFRHRRGPRSRRTPRARTGVGDVTEDHRTPRTGGDRSNARELSDELAAKRSRWAFVSRTRRRRSPTRPTAASRDYANGSETFSRAWTTMQAMRPRRSLPTVRTSWRPGPGLSATAPARECLSSSAGCRSPGTRAARRPGPKATCAAAKPSRPWGLSARRGIAGGGAVGLAVRCRCPARGRIRAGDRCSSSPTALRASARSRYHAPARGVRRQHGPRRYRCSS